MNILRIKNSVSEKCMFISGAWKQAFMQFERHLSQNSVIFVLEEATTPRKNIFACISYLHFYIIIYSSSTETFHKIWGLLISSLYVWAYCIRPTCIC